MSIVSAGVSEAATKESILGQLRMHLIVTLRSILCLDAFSATRRDTGSPRGRRKERGSQRSKGRL